MGMLIDGKWEDQPLVASDKGRFVRRDSSFRSWITADGSAPKGSPNPLSGYKAERGRYHLYVGYACPWAQRTLIMRALKGLEDIISVSVVHWLMLENGWTFAKADGVIADPVGHADFLYQVYQRADSAYTGRVTIPVLWDLKTGTIVNNESSEIIRMLGNAFDGIGATPGDYYPQHLRADIDAVNDRIYNTLNNGVYRAGFATTQAAYEEAVIPLFETLDFVEARLAQHRYLCGDVLTEADIRLLTTLLRFDAIYYSHFKCNKRRIADYPNIWGFTRDLVQRPKIASTFRLDHCKKHYYGSQLQVNPTGIVPIGPEIDFAAPHDRDRFG
ncbi:MULTISPECIES: glutathione S-transferase family protein [unclassified Beijerinckia]|uniref:glutathione S-transferase family protein n=1 Tax=unclassified Beijerinckia TaxID=2638183 RepID=UPI000895B944|nr:MULTISPECIES: glutathione S-transferase family protein [unclassified Beijerinckia]MDH7797716.1 putative glutathione S-transferase [Beijerinckia sp. GAS462]SEC96045.1 putative glutathione S-transferase [Beijerinckia sp. 28-YEA-48]